MKILHVLLYSQVGGVENYTRDLFPALERAGHRNVLLVSGEPLPGLLSPDRALYRLPFLVGLSSAATRRIVGRISRIIEIERPDVAYLHAAIDRVVAEVILSRLPTVYFAHTYDAFSPSGALLYQRDDSVCTLSGVPDWRCLVNAYLQRCNTRRPLGLIRRYRRANESMRWIRAVDGIVCDSEYVRRRHVENGFPNERCHVLPSPITIPPADVASRRRPEALILFVGRITPQKGLGYLIRALTGVSNACTLLVAGDGYQMPAMRRLVADLRLGDRVRFLGSLERDAVQDLYLRAAVVVMPSVWPEPFGMVGPEAMSYGVPVVASQVGGIPEWLADGECGYLVPPRDVKGLADRIQGLLADPALATRLGSRGREIAQQRYGLDQHAAHLARLFEAVQAGRSTATVAA